MRTLLLTLSLFTLACEAPKADEAHSQAGAQRSPGDPLQPSILVVLNSHSHSYGLEEELRGTPEFWTRKATRYETHKEEVLWLDGLADSLGFRMSYQLNGEYLRDAREAWGDEAHIRDLEAEGHELSLHFHQRALHDDEFWGEVHAPGADMVEADIRQVWTAHLAEFEATVGHSSHRVDAACPRENAEQWRTFDDLISENGVEVIAAGETFSWTEYNHNPWNPYRPAEGSEHVEDTARDLVSVASYSQIGELEPNGLHRVSTSVPQLQRQFLMALANRHYAQWLGDPAKVWTFGAMTHPDSNGRHREDVEQWATFLTRLTEADDAFGTPITQWATSGEVKDSFVEWEAAGGRESFSFDVEAHTAGDPQPYPYRLPALATGLYATELVDVIKVNNEVRAFELQRREMYLEEDDWGREGMVVTDRIEGKVLLIWSPDGTERTVDLSSRIPGVVAVLDGDDGDVRRSPATSVEIGPLPILVGELAFEAWW